MSETVEVSTGVKFEVKDVPLMAIEAIKKKVNKDRPKPPVNWIESKAREEINYNDPGYQEAVKEFDAKMTLEIYDGLIMLGTKVESVPEGFPGVDDNWDEEYKLLEIELHEGKLGRYLDWVKFCAAPGSDDILKLMTACGRKAGVREEDVREASEAFRRDQERGAD